MAQVVAAQTVVLIDVGGLGVGYTEITYDFDGRPWVLWWRYVGMPGSAGVPTRWFKVHLEAKLLETKPDASPEEIRRSAFEGRFRSEPLVPGQLLEYGIMNRPEHLDPNTGSLEGELVSRIAIVGVGLHQDGDWIDDQFKQVGGTYYYHQFDTIPHGSVHARLQISRDAPERDNMSPSVVAQPELTVWSPFGPVHELEGKPLLPGNRYFATMLLVDRDGYWTELPVADFVTKLRRIDIRFPKVHIVNDGDPGGTGEAEFAFRLFEGAEGGPMHQLVGLQYGDDDDPIDVTDNQDITNPFSPVTIGPRGVTPQTKDMKVVVSGTEYDGVGEDDEYARSENSLPLPAGRRDETVSNWNLPYTAEPWSGNFKYTLWLSFDATYV